MSMSEFAARQALIDALGNATYEWDNETLMLNAAIRINRLQAFRAKALYVLQLVWSVVKYRGVSITLSPADHIAIRDEIEKIIYEQS